MVELTALAKLFLAYRYSFIEPFTLEVIQPFDDDGGVCLGFIRNGNISVYRIGDRSRLFSQIGWCMAYFPCLRRRCSFLVCIVKGAVAFATISCERHVASFERQSQ